MPPLAALLLVVLFTALGFWQLERADQKRALQASFDAEGRYLPIEGDAAPALYQRIEATGRFLNERQFLIDNMVQDGRLGYYVITPLELAEGRPLLLVNRGWIAKDPRGGKPAIAVDAATRTVQGRAGHLPRVGVRPGTALANAGDWPKLATFPSVEDLASVLHREVLPFVLLANPDPSSPLARRWEPQQIGPARHLGYAFQWFALAIAVVAVSAVVYRKQRASR
jgi:surfeit locus 1 family protein